MESITEEKKQDFVDPAETRQDLILVVEIKNDQVLEMKCTPAMLKTMQL